MHWFTGKKLREKNFLKLYRIKFKNFLLSSKTGVHNRQIKTLMRLTEPSFFCKFKVRTGIIFLSILRLGGFQYGSHRYIWVKHPLSMTITWYPSINITLTKLYITNIIGMNFYK